MLHKFLDRYCNEKSIMTTLFAIEALKGLIFWLIPGDIDFKAYMQQTGIILKGERDYTKIESDNGVMWYPAIHAYIHIFIYYITNKGDFLKVAQLFSFIIHWINLSIIIKITKICFKENTKIRCILFMLMIEVIGTHLSAQYVFNDVYMTTLAHGSILWFLLSNQHAQHNNRIYNYKTVIRYQLLGILLMSLSMSIKLSAFLYFPALLLITSLNQGILTSIIYTLVIAILSVAYGAPFWIYYPKSYFSVAYNLNKGFDLVVSQNYFFLSDEIFSSPLFAKSLLILQLVLLVGALFTKWLSIKEMFKVLGIYPFKFGILSPNQVKRESFAPLSLMYIAEVFFVCNFIGIFCLKSMHNQFCYWYIFSVPFLLVKNLKSINNLWTARYCIVYLIHGAWFIYYPLILKAIIIQLWHIWIIIKSFGIYYDDNETLKKD